MPESKVSLTNVPHHNVILFAKNIRPAARAHQSSGPFFARSLCLAQKRAPTASMVAAVSTVDVMRRSLWFATYPMVATRGGGWKTRVGRRRRKTHDASLVDGG